MEFVLPRVYACWLYIGPSGMALAMDTSFFPSRFPGFCYAGNHSDWGFGRYSRHLEFLQPQFGRLRNCSDHADYPLCAMAPGAPIGLLADVYGFMVFRRLVLRRMIALHRP